MKNFKFLNITFYMIFFIYNVVNAQLPVNNINNWDRVYFNGGWYFTTQNVTNNQLPAGSTRTVNPPLPHKAFEVVTLGQISSDPNFISVNMPTGLSPSAMVIRVGTRIGNNNNTNTLDDGAAAMATINLPINKTNYRYKVRVLGLKEKVGTNNPQHNNFNFESNDVSPAFGYHLQPTFKTSYQNPMSNPTTIGMNEYGLYKLNTSTNPISFDLPLANVQYFADNLANNRYSRFDRKSNSHFLDVNQTTNINGVDYYKMNAWDTQEINLLTLRKKYVEKA